MPRRPTKLAGCVSVLAMVSSLALPAMAQVAEQQTPAPQPPASQPAGLPGLSAESFYGKEPTEGVYVRDSAGAVEKLALAQKMERLKEWGKSADLYQEVIARYTDRVVPSQLDRDKKIYQYTSITNPVQERLSHWPQEGLDAYRARFEPAAAEILDAARDNDAAALNRVYSLYFVTEAGKAAGIRLIDLYLESGEYPAAAWIGDRLLTLHPTLTAERAAVLYRTALAQHYAGEAANAAQRLSDLKTHYPADRGTVRGKDVVLADSLAKEIESPIEASEFASADSWPVPFGDSARGRISTADGKPGARLYGIALSKPNWNAVANLPARDNFEGVYEASVREGMTLGVLPVTDRGELYFQDGQRVYAVGLESGVPLPGWAQTYPNGQYTISGGMLGTSRGHQLSLTLTEHEVLAIMCQPDLSPQIAGMLQQPTEARLVCLDRQFGKEKWTVALSQLPEEAKDCRALAMSGSPLVVGDAVLVIARGAKTQFEDCYVIAFDLATGKFRWTTYVASASSNIANQLANGMPTPGAGASHLAYANGRVYVQTNLGALAALDAYTGAIVWLDIYPTGRQPENIPRFNRFNAGSELMGPAHKPWTYNPVIVRDGYVFTLPTEGDNLLIYDAATGIEVKRIDVKDIGQKWDAALPEVNRTVPVLDTLDTLVGVIGDKLILAGDKEMICINWKNYDKDAFNVTHDNITVWPNRFPKNGEADPAVRGRAFIARNVVFVPCQDRLYCLSLKTGKTIAEYPVRPASGADGKWEDPEEPGNVLVTNDHVIIAGAKMVNVYTDLTLAKARLDKALADNPADPQPHLRYAEILFVTADADGAIARLDKAADLLGGKNARLGVDRDRLFNDALTFADKLAKSDNDDDRARAVKLYDRAAMAASSPVQQVHLRLSRGKFNESRNDSVAAIGLYEEILFDSAMRAVPMVDEAANTPAQADVVAEKAIAAVVKAHPGAFDSFEQTAGAQLEEMKASKDDPAGKLLELARRYPNSTSASKAMIAAADAYEAAGNSRRAIRVLHDLWFKSSHDGADSAQAARIQIGLARNYLALSRESRPSVGNMGPLGNAESAAAALARAASLDAALKLDQPLTLRTGAILPAGADITSALEAVRKDRFSEAKRTLADLHIPDPPRYKPGVKTRFTPFLKPDPARDEIANIHSLALPLHEFARPGRVVASTSDGIVEIFPAGDIKPLSSSRALSDGAIACAWLGDDVLAWNASQIASIHSGTGEAAWRLDLRELQAIDVVRVGDNPQAQLNVALDPNGQFNNNGAARVRVRIRNGQRVIFRPGMPPMVIPQQPAALINPVNPAVANAAPEQIVDVRPVGEHVIISTSAGRVIALELVAGRMAWQTRLSDRPVDRLLANDDFTIVRMSDESTVRIAVFDTATGQLRSTRSWLVQAGMTPINMALAADGTLVYTFADRLCLKDLYKPWGDKPEIETTTQPAVAVFQSSTEPGQLLISEGRILALADDGPVKNVRVYSLETGQPLSLRYESGQGVHEVDRILSAGKSDKAVLRVNGPHLYVVSTGVAYSYNLDRPNESWIFDQTLAPPPVPFVNPRDVSVCRNLLTVIDAEIPDAAPAAGVNLNPNIPQVQPPQPPQVQPAPAAGVAAAGAAAPPDLAPAYRIYCIRLSPISQTNSAERGILGCNERIADPAGITSQWQAVDGGFYYLTGDNKLHVLRGSGQ